MIYDELIKRDIKDLRVLAAQYSIPTHHRAKAETIAKLIIEHITTKIPQIQPQDSMKHPAEQPQANMAVNSEEAVRGAIKKYLENEKFTATFPGDDTVIFKCRGAEESVHLSTIMRVIVSKAQSVSVGARNMRVIRDNPTNSTANSGTIMML